MSVSYAPPTVYADYSQYNQREAQYSPSSALVDAHAQEAPEVLAQVQAREFKKKIEKFLCAYMGKGSWKAARIVERIPTNDPIRLENLYEVLNILKTDKKQRVYLNEQLSWSKNIEILIILCACSCCEETTADIRLTLRALMLYSLSAINIELRNTNVHKYDSQVNSAHCIINDLRDGDYDTLKRTLADAQEHIKRAEKSNDRNAIKEMEELYFIDLQVLPAIITALVDKDLCSRR